MTGVTRRQLLERSAAFAAGAAVLEHLPRALRIHGWLEDAYAATPDVVTQTMNGLVAFVVPGRDLYSRTQGTRTKTRGGIEAGATKRLIRTLDAFLPSTPPLSSAAATILNGVAANVAPPNRGRANFASAFANLSFAQKAKVFQTLEGFQGEEAGSIRFLAGNLPGLAAFVAYSARPVGWRLAHYSGIAEGRAEFKGYYQGRRAAEP